MASTVECRLTVRCPCGKNHTWTVRADHTTEPGTEFACSCPKCHRSFWFRWAGDHAEAAATA